MCTPVAVWRRELSLLLEVLKMEVSTATPVLVAGIPPLRGVPEFRGAFGRMGDRHAVTLNSATATVCRDLAATFVALPPQDPGSDRYRTAIDYRVWAGVLAQSLATDMSIADPVAAATNSDGGTDSMVDMTIMSRESPSETARVLREGPQQEDERQAALDALRILDTAPETRLDDIVAAARAAFGTRFAAFTLIDRDRQWIKSRVGFDASEGHRVDDLCVLTVQRGSVLVVADVGGDVRFGSRAGDHQDPGVGFFAGQAVESPSGHRIGVLCVFDPEPREIGSLEPTQLAGFAHAIADEVWRRGTDATE